ncbi:MAG: membrane protein insertion efficiency factor YidD [Ruminococcus sp.]|nr:membrane protein insertion efficiency factor YidD [Ruminococcus sp.]
MKYVAIGLIKFYRKFISPLFPATCRFYPTCSNYALQVYREWGFWKGSLLTFRRISKCHPFNEGGVDLPPKRENRHS